jgi:hypothetical protein
MESNGKGQNGTDVQQTAAGGSSALSTTEKVFAQH